MAASFAAEALRGRDGWVPLEPYQIILASWTAIDDPSVSLLFRPLHRSCNPFDVFNLVMR